MGTKLRYDGKYDWIKDSDSRQWTFMSHFIDATGRDQFKNSVIGAARVREILGIK